MAATRLDIDIEQGADFNYILTVNDGTEQQVPIDLTGFNLRSQLRKSSSDTVEAATFEFEISDQTANKGQALWSLSSVKTRAIPCASFNAANFGKTTQYVYDIEMFSVDDDGVESVIRIFEGIATVRPEVTK